MLRLGAPQPGPQERPLIRAAGQQPAARSAASSASGAPALVEQELGPRPLREAGLGIVMELQLVQHFQGFVAAAMARCGSPFEAATRRTSGATTVLYRAAIDQTASITQYDRLLHRRSRGLISIPASASTTAFDDMA